MIKWIKNIFQQKSSLSSNRGVRVVYLSDSDTPFLTWNADFLSTKYNQKDFREFICQAFAENAYVNMVVSRISDVQSSLPRSFKNEDEEVVTVSKDLIDLIKKPNPILNTKLFYDEIGNYLDSTGNAIVYPVKSVGFSTYQQLYVARMDDIDINTTTGDCNGLPVSYEISNAKGYNGNTVTIDAKDILHIKHSNIIDNSNYGISPLFALQKAYTASNKNFEARVATYDNGGATGIVSPKSTEMPLTPDEQNDVQKVWDAKTAGTHNRGKILALKTAVDFTKIGMSPEELQLIASMPADLRVVCGRYGVDPVLFGDAAGMTFTNREVAEKNLYEHVAPSQADRIDEALSEWLIQKNFGLEGVKYSIDRKNKSKEAKVIQRNTDIGKSQIIDIAKSFTSNQLTESSAVGILELNYAYTTEEARQILGI